MYWLEQALDESHKDVELDDVEELWQMWRRENEKVLRRERRGADPRTKRIMDVIPENGDTSSGELRDEIGRLREAEGGVEEKGTGTFEGKENELGAQGPG